MLQRLCLGRRRLFFQFEGQKIVTETGLIDYAPAGWLTLQEDKRIMKDQFFDIGQYEDLFLKRQVAGGNAQVAHDFYLGTTNEIE